MKLATLGVDSRSTATTILAVRSLIELQSDTSLKREARKLLSFTDNRQDASLQAGHFNDFSQVALLRSALHKATVSKGSAGLAHGEQNFVGHAGVEEGTEHRRLFGGRRRFRRRFRRLGERWGNQG